jgi:hypothetical protein
MSDSEPSQPCQERNAAAKLFAFRRRVFDHDGRIGTRLVGRDLCARFLGD